MDLRTPATRREFMKFSATTAAGAFAAVQMAKVAAGAQDTTKTAVSHAFISMTALPYAYNALAPYLSEKTLHLHYDDHHKSYYKRLLGYIAQFPAYDKIPLQQLVEKTKDSTDLTDHAVYTSAVLLYNHNLLWECTKPNGGIGPEKDSFLTQRIIQHYGSIKAFRTKFIDKAMETGIGWVWLMKKPDGTLDIVRTQYHESINPFVTPTLLTLDVWEHAYYIDYENNRQKYVEAFLDHLVNWQYAEKKYGPVESKQTSSGIKTTDTKVKEDPSKKK